MWSRIILLEHKSLF